MRIPASRLLLLSSCTLYFSQPLHSQQTTTYDFENGVPVGWRSESAVAQPSGSPQQGNVLALTGAASFGEVDVTNASTITFSRGPAQGADDFVLHVEAKCPGAPLVTRDIQYTAGATASTTAFVPEIIPVRQIGSCPVRWSYQRYGSGVALIDNVIVTRLTQAETDAIVLENTIRSVVASELVTAQQVDNLVRTSQSVGPGLANLSSRVYAVGAIDKTASALVTGATLGNPLSYDYFKQMSSTLESFSPRPVQTHLQTIQSQLNASYNELKPQAGKSILQTLSSLALSTSMANFQSTFQSVIALSSIGKDLLRRVAGVFGFGGNDQQKEGRAEQQLNTMYTESNTFLGKMREQTEHVRQRAARADSIADAANRLAASADTTILSLIRISGLPDSVFGAFKEAAMKQADARPLTDAERQLLQRYSTGLQNARQRAATNNAIPAFAAQLRAVLEGSDAVYAGYEPLIARQKQFYEEEIAYLCQIKKLDVLSLASAETQRQWLDNARTAVSAFVGAREAFYNAYTPAKPAPALGQCELTASPR